MKIYPSIKNYLERVSLFSIGKLKIRLHRILSADGTPFLHNHPFCFLSIIIKGNYIEQLLVNDKVIEKTHTVGSIIIRTSKQYHRIKSANNCKTLFFAFYNNKNWNLKEHYQIKNEGYNFPLQKGIYLRVINDVSKYCKFDKFWYIGSSDIEIAKNETRLSIYQVENWSKLIIEL